MARGGTLPPRLLHARLDTEDVALLRRPPGVKVAVSVLRPDQPWAAVRLPELALPLGRLTPVCLAVGLDELGRGVRELGRLRAVRRRRGAQALFALGLSEAVAARS